MTIPLWSLLGFAVWTLLLLLGTVGVYRWTQILTGRAPIRSFRADNVEGADWYRRAMRAHTNCVENLPVFAAIVLISEVTGVRDSLLDKLCLVVLLARVFQSLVHVGFSETNRSVTSRFLFFATQLVATLWIAVIIARGAA